MDWMGRTMPLNLQNLKFCRHSIPPQVSHPTTLLSTLNLTDPTLNIKMKYSEACHLKALINRSITTLERSIVEQMITTAGRKWLVAANMSHPCDMLRDVLNMDWQHNEVELEGQAYKMSWDWDTEDIDLDENDGWMWVPITPKKLEDKAKQFAETKPAVAEAEEEVPTIRSEPHWMMSIHAVTNGPGGVVQASTPVFQVVKTLITGPRATVQLPSEWSRIPESSMGMEDPIMEQAVHSQPRAKVG